MTRSFLADEHVKRVFVTELRANGYDVAWVDADYESGTSDRAHLKQSGESNRAILSNDADFARLHGEYEHAGIVLYDDQNMSVTEFVKGIRLIERFVPAEELRGEIVWLDDWIE
jgi:predicted nuclease of predicted toxin-antitoxin system